MTARTVPYGLARNAAALGDRDRAIYWLERSYAKREGSLIMLAVDPGFDPLRADTRFQDLLARMKLRL